MMSKTSQHEGQRPAVSLLPGPARHPSVALLWVRHPRLILPFPLEQQLPCGEVPVTVTGNRSLSLEMASGGCRSCLPQGFSSSEPALSRPRRPPLDPQHLRCGAAWFFLSFVSWKGQWPVIHAPCPRQPCPGCPVCSPLSQLLICHRLVVPQGTACVLTYSLTVRPEVPQNLGFTPSPVTSDLCAWTLV